MKRDELFVFVAAPLVFLAIPILLASFFQYGALAPWGSSAFLWFVPFVVVLPGLAAVLVFGGSLIGLLREGARRKSCVYLLLSSALILGTWAGIRIGRHIRTEAFQQLATRSESLILAIESYVNRHGGPPESLEKLVPDYIAAIPSTGLASYPHYDYAMGDKLKDCDGNPWMLYVFTPSGGINFDQFIYLPLQNYPKYGYGGSVQRIGKWAYIHE